MARVMFTRLPNLIDNKFEKFANDAIHGAAMLVARMGLPLIRCLWTYDEWVKMTTREKELRKIIKESK